MKHTQQFTGSHLALFVQVQSFSQFEPYLFSGQATQAMEKANLRLESRLWEIKSTYLCCKKHLPSWKRIHEGALVGGSNDAQVREHVFWLVPAIRLQRLTQQDSHTHSGEYTCPCDTSLDRRLEETTTNRLPVESSACTRKGERCK